MKNVILMLMLTATITAMSQERGDNFIIVTLNSDNERDNLREVNKQLLAAGWSVANANMDFGFIETTRRPMLRFNTHLTLHISVTYNKVHIRGQWFNERVFGENPQTLDFVRSRGNVQHEMWEETMKLVNSLSPVSIEYKKQ